MTISAVAAKKTLLTVFVALLCSGGASLAANFALRTWQSDDGLPDNVVRSVSSGPCGYLWVATQSGLSRFDGVQFEPIQLPAHPQGLDTVVTRMLLARDQSMWLDMGRGDLLRAALDEGHRLNFTWLTNHSSDTYVLSMAEDSKGALWFSLRNGRVQRIEGNRIIEVGEGEGLPGGNYACWLASDVSGRIWAAKRGHLGVFEGSRFHSTHVLETTSVRLCTRREGGLWVRVGEDLMKFQEGEAPQRVATLFDTERLRDTVTMFEDQAGAVWVASAYRGLVRYADGEVVKVQDSYADVGSICQDREGNVWLGTRGEGLKRARLTPVKLHTQESGLPYAAVNSVDEDAEATLWVVMGNGFVARRLTNGWERLTASDVWAAEDATCLVAEPRGGVWIGTRWNGLYHYEQGRFRHVDRSGGLASDYIRSLLVDRAGDLWIGLGGSNCVQRLSGEQFTTIPLPLDGQPIRALTQDAGGAIWAGDADGNLYSIRDDQVTEETGRTLSPRRAIRCLQAAPEGGVLIGYARDGLGWLRSNRFVHLSVQCGLLQRDVSQILADANGDLWLGGNRGLSHLRRADWEAYVGAKTERLHSFTYGRHEGLSNLEASYGAAPAGVHSRDGRLWLATRTGLLEVNPSQAHFNPSPPPVFIEHILVDQQPVPIPRGALICEETSRRQAGGGNANALHLSPEHRRLDLEFTALNFTAPELTRFQYKLDGYEEEWTEVGDERRVSYGRLPPGRYRFHVRAGNESNVWNESGATIAFRVSLFFWQTWWFVLTAVALATLGIAFVVRRVSYRRLRMQMERLEREAMLNAERARIARDLHDDLGANLTQLALQSELIGGDLAQPARVAGRLDRLATRARDLIKTLDEIVWAANPRNDTLQDLLEYMGQFTSDFLASAGIRCRLDLPDELSDKPVTGEDRHTLYLVVKEALHNVVKHAAASEVWLRAAETDEALVMSVEDNGQGVEPGKADAWSDGLRNMRERLAAIGGTLELNSQPAQGTVVSIRFPWPKD